jgi:hypothetical protein
MATLNITSALLMGLFLIAIAAAFIRLRNWEEATAVREAESGLDLLEDAFNSPAIWTVLFVVVALGLTMLAVALVGGAPLPGLALPGQGLIESAFIGVVGLVFGVFLFLGLFAAAQSRGLSNAPAVAFSAIMVGLIFVTIVTIKLLMAG